MKIAVVGAGYVGLVSGVCLADIGHEVVCLDRDAIRIAGLQQGRMPIFEPGLAELVKANVAAGRLRFTADTAVAMGAAEVIMIAVGTPLDPETGTVDLTAVEAVTETIATLALPASIVVVKSTVPVGTGDRLEAMLERARPGADLAVVSNPEFLREGAAIREFMHPDRIVVGTDDARAQAIMRAVYAPLADAPLHLTSRRSAEIIKNAANAFLAMKIAFVNEIADFCEKTGGEVGEVARGIGLDPRIGAAFLRAGPGYGGSCLPKDTAAFVRSGVEVGSRLRLIETTVSLNDARKHSMAERVVAACGGTVENKRIGVLGLSFKPETDDMRESPALPLIAALRAAGAEIVAHDPQAMRAAQALLPAIGYAEDPYGAAAGADCLVIVTEWSQFRALDLARIKSLMREAVVVDLRNLLEPETLEQLGFAYSRIGRGNPQEKIGLGEPAAGPVATSERRSG